MYDSRADAPSSAALSEMTTALAGPSPAANDAERIERIRHFEQLKAAIAAAQARESAAFAASQRAELTGTKVAAERAGQSIAQQVGLARRCSAFQARRYLGWAKVLTTELPHTLAALTAGVTTEWRAMLLARETAWLSREHRSQVDRELAPRLESLGDRRTEREAARIAYRLDPDGAAERRRTADKDRRVRLRPAPDTMTRLTALLPLVHGVATYQALLHDADTEIAAGDPRSRGQIMADTLIERVTGQTSPQAVPVEVHLILTDQTLLAPAGTPGHDEPAVITGHGPIPAAWARELIHTSTAPIWLR